MRAGVVITRHQRHGRGALRRQRPRAHEAPAVAREDDHGVIANHDEFIAAIAIGIDRKHAGRFEL